MINVHVSNSHKRVAVKLSLKIGQSKKKKTTCKVPWDMPWGKFQHENGNKMSSFYQSV